MEKICDILTEGGRILKMGERLEETEEFRRLPRHEIQTIDAEGYIVAPGFVDVHVHFRDPGFTDKEDILTGAAAAAAGGFTSVVMMANTKPAADNEDTLRYMLERGRDTPIHVYACGAVTKNLEGRELTDMKGLKAAGAAGFTDDGKPLMDEALVRRAMEECKELGVPVSFHEEDPAYIRESGVNAGEAAEALGLTGADRQAEISLIKRDIRLALQTGACVNIQHISTKEGVELVREAKAEGADVHAEATPHHFTLTENAVEKHGTLAKMNPPLRTEEDKAAIIEGLRDGTIDLIATDHAPHTKEEKGKSFTEAPSGIIGLETAHMLDDAVENKGRDTDLRELEDITRIAGIGSMCQFGKHVLRPVYQAMKLFPDEFRSHIVDHKCLAGSCVGEQNFQIDPLLCTGCGSCVEVCEYDAIDGKAKFIHMIDKKMCEKCEACVDACEEGAIKVGQGLKVPTRMTKVGRFRG